MHGYDVHYTLNKYTKDVHQKLLVSLPLTRQTLLEYARE